MINVITGQYYSLSSEEVLESIDCESQFWVDEMEERERLETTNKTTSTTRDDTNTTTTELGPDTVMTDLNNSKISEEFDSNFHEPNQMLQRLNQYFSNFSSCNNYNKGIGMTETNPILLHSSMTTATMQQRQPSGCRTPLSTSNYINDSRCRESQYHYQHQQIQNPDTSTVSANYFSNLTIADNCNHCSNNIGLTTPTSTLINNNQRYYDTIDTIQRERYCKNQQQWRPSLGLSSSYQIPPCVFNLPQKVSKLYGKMSGLTKHKTDRQCQTDVNLWELIKELKVIYYERKANTDGVMSNKIGSLKEVPSSCLTTNDNPNIQSRTVESGTLTEDNFTGFCNESKCELNKRSSDEYNSISSIYKCINTGTGQSIVVEVPSNEMNHKVIVEDSSNVFMINNGAEILKPKPKLSTELKVQIWIKSEVRNSSRCGDKNDDDDDDDVMPLQKLMKTRYRTN